MEPDSKTAPAAPPPVRSREQVIGDGIAWTSRWSLRWVLIALGAWLLGFIISTSWTVVLPVVLALIISTVLGPITMVMRNKLRFPPALAAVATLLAALGVIVGVGFIIKSSVAGQAGEIVSDTDNALQQLQGWVQDSNIVSMDQINSTLQDVQDKLRGSAADIASGVLTGVTVVGNWGLTLVISLVLTFFFLKDGDRFVPMLRRLAGSTAGGHLAEVLNRSWETLSGFIRTQAVVSMVDAVFIGAGLLIVGVPLAIPLAVLTFLGGFVPIVGAVVMGAIAVLVALVSNGLTGALIVLAIVLGVQQLESNILSPWLQAKSMNLHAAVVLLSVMLGGTLFGIIGAFLAVPVAAVTGVVLRYLIELTELKSADPAPEADGPEDGSTVVEQDDDESVRSSAGPSAGPSTGPSDTETS